MPGQFSPVLIGGGPSRQAIYDLSTTPIHKPGTRGTTPDGRTWEYVRSDSSTAIGKGKLATYDPIVAAIDKISVQANTGAGSSTLPVTVTVTLTEGELFGASITVEQTGVQYGVLGFSGSGTGAPQAHTAGTLTLFLDRPLEAALTTSNTVTLNFGPCAVKISAGVTANAEAVEVAAGVPAVDVPAGNVTPQYFWVQKTGRAAVLFGTVVGSVGLAVYQGEDAGSFQLSVDTTAQNAQVVLGTILALLPVDTEYHPVMLSIA